LDMLQGLTVLASQKSKKADANGDLKRPVTATTLTPGFFKSLRKNPDDGFDEAVQAQLTQASRVRQTTDLLRWKPGTDDTASDPGNDPGLPLIMIPRLKLHTWLPVLRWMEMRPANAPTATPAERDALLRYVLIDHFFADWHDKPDERLRDYLDEVGVAAAQVAPLSLPNDVDAWLKGIQVPNAVNLDALNDHRLPLSPNDMAQRFARQSARDNRAANDDGALWMRGRSDDLLMWAQRSAVEAWFGKLADQLLHLGEIGRPWDWDHITPQDFFNHHGAHDNGDVPVALSALWSGAASLAPDRAWSLFRQLRDRTGNYRIWPMGFNRRDGDEAPCVKLQVPQSPADVSDHIVLAPWLAAQVGQPDALRDASAIASAQPWDQTPGKKGLWSLQEMQAFVTAVGQREQAVYQELWEFVKPALPDALQANRV